MEKYMLQNNSVVIFMREVREMKYIVKYVKSNRQPER